MAHPQRPRAPYLIRDVQFNGHKYNFFHAVRLLQKLEGERGLIGTDLSAAQEALRFSVSNSLIFPKGDVAGISMGRTQDDGRVFHVETTFLGLHGVDSPLPSSFVHELAQGTGLPNTRKQFFDYFHHRLLSLFYQSWQKYRYFVTYNPLARKGSSSPASQARGEAGREDAMTQRIFALLGLYLPELRFVSVEAATTPRPEEQVPWIRLLSFSGLIASRSRSPAMLCGVLEASFLTEAEREGTHLPAYQKVHERGDDARHLLQPARFHARPFLERTVYVPPRQQWRLGVENSHLSHNSILGRRVRDIQGKYALVIDRLTFGRFLDFLPSGLQHKALKTLIKFLSKDQKSIELSVKVDMEGRPEFTLARGSALRLGWSTFLGRVSEPTRDVRVQLAG